MAITVISGTIPVNVGTLATSASATLSSTYLSSSYSASYFGSSTTASLRQGSSQFSVNGVNVVFFSGSTDKVNDSSNIYINDFPFTPTAAVFAQSASAVFNATASVQNSATTYPTLQGVTAVAAASTVIFSAGGVGGYAYPNVIQAANFIKSGSTTTNFSGATLVTPTGSGKVTTGGPWTTITALSEACVVVSGSNASIGEASFTLGAGETFTAYSGSGTAAIIQAITVGNPNGSVVAQ